MFKNLSLHFKVIFAFLLIALVLTVVSFYQIRSTQHFSGLFESLINEDYQRVNALENIELSTVDLRDQRVAYQQDVTAMTLDKAAVAKTGVIAQVRTVQGDVQAYLGLTTIDNPNVNQQTIKTIAEASDQVVKGTLADINGQNTTANQASLRTAQTQLDEAINTASSADRKGIASEGIEIHNTVSTLLLTIIGLAVSTAVLAIVLGVTVSLWLSRSLIRIKDGAERIAAGDFSRPIIVRSKDEIGQLSSAFNHMAERLKEAYQRQAVAKQRDEAMLLSMGEGLIAMDSAGKVTLINKIACNLLELPDESAAMGKMVQDVYQLYAVDDKSSQPLPLAQRPGFTALDSGTGASNVFVFLKADGRKYLLNITATPIKLGGTVIGAITVLRDVTKEKEIDRMKTEFISLASHQLRTPLSAIRWFSEMLVSGDAGKLLPEQLDFATNIADSTQRMIDLVNALLNIARIESGRIMVDPKPTDLKELVSGIISDLKAKTVEKQQNMIISVHADLPKINLDPRLIGQVYMNLLTNAIKYTPKGGEISVFISRKGDDIISQVTDNGYGIPKAQQDRVFQKFFRAANAVKVETDGTGLGLYLIKSVVESSGGKIWFSSEEGKGTTFWFSMPMSGMKAKEGEVTLDV